MRGVSGRCWWSWLFTVAFGLLLPHALRGAHTPDARWRQVEAALTQGLHRSAIDLLDSIATKALSEDNGLEATRAIVRKVVLEAGLQRGGVDEKIRRLESAIAQAPPELAPVLEAVLAHWYWEYLSSRKWTLLQRAPEQNPPTGDLALWDLPRLLAEVDRRFQAALSAAEVLQRTPISADDELWPRGNLPDTYRPTLYDFIAFEALAFYAAGEQAAGGFADDLEVLRADELFAPVEAFLAWQPNPPPTRSPMFAAIRLYQDVLRFHQNDAERSAYLDADLHRLFFAKNVAIGPDVAARFQGAMRRYIEQHSAHELSSVAAFYLAKSFQLESQPAAARALAQQSIERHPGSRGAGWCRDLVADLDRPLAELATEHTWTAPWPAIEIRHRNLTQYHFRLLPYEWRRFLEETAEFEDHRRRRWLGKLTDRRSLRQWTESLEATPDLRERSTRTRVPTDLPPGFYLLLGSRDPQFRARNNQLDVAPVWVSRLTVLVRPDLRGVEGFVLDAQSGEPQSGAEVQLFTHPSFSDRHEWEPGPKQQTDTNGFFTFGHGDGELLIHARQGAESVISPPLFGSGPRSPANPADVVVLFTDRPLYRPGQMIRYKGICAHLDPEKGDWHTLEDTEATLVFRGALGTELGRQTHRSNAQGSFAGSFLLPQTMLTGRISLTAAPPLRGLLFVAVEEYKRPTFQVRLEAPQEPCRLGEIVRLTGRAQGYAEAGVSGARVAWQVLRQTETRAYSSYGWDPNLLQFLASGRVETAADGHFAIEFVAQPDPVIPEAAARIFKFEVRAEVTDPAGETQSASLTTRIGSAALEAALEADEWLTDDAPVRLRVIARTLDGAPLRSSGRLQIHTLRQPEQVLRPPAIQPRFAHHQLAADHRPPLAGPETEPSDPASWVNDQLLAEAGFTTGDDGHVTVPQPLPAGLYRATAEMQDAFGQSVSVHRLIHVLHPEGTRLEVRLPHALALHTGSAEVGGSLLLVWGTGYDRGRACIEVERDRRVALRRWTEPDQTQQAIRIGVPEFLRGGFRLRVTSVKENRAYCDSRVIEVPWSNKHLQLKWEHFNSRLNPGQAETWTAVVQRADSDSGDERPGTPTPEIVATLYDASLDALLPEMVRKQSLAMAMSPLGGGSMIVARDARDWPRAFDFFPVLHQDPSLGDGMHFANRWETFEQWSGGPPPRPLDFGWRYRQWDPCVAERHFLPEAIRRLAAIRANINEYFPPRVMTMGLGDGTAKSPKADPARVRPRTRGPTDPAFNPAGDEADREVSSTSVISPDALHRVLPRRNLEATALFLPQLVANSNGTVRIPFTTPESLTRWRFLAFAHDADCRSGFLEGQTITARELMIQPNPPRFLREGDELEFSVRVANQSDRPQAGVARLSFRDVLTDVPVGDILREGSPDQDFELRPGESRVVSWPIRVPSAHVALGYRTIAATDLFSDGEEGAIAVLPRRILLTESLPLGIRGPGQRRFEFSRVKEAASSATLRHQSLTIQMASNPAWYAVRALPYLVAQPHECTEQLFNRLYADLLARHLAQSQPALQTVIRQWRHATNTLLSPLEQNPDLKAIGLAETPWVRQAQTETQARQHLATLFDPLCLDNDIHSSLVKLRNLRGRDGLWPWFPGGPGDEYVTLYILAGTGRLRQMGALDARDRASRGAAGSRVVQTTLCAALDPLDHSMAERHRQVRKLDDPAGYIPSPAEAMYLYARSFFLKDQPIRSHHQPAIDFWLTQSRKLWLQTGNRQSQGHLALALHRWGGAKNLAAAQGVVRSLRERSLTDGELGRFWRDAEPGWWWFRAPIETHALMIEVFDEIAGDPAVVEELKVWLLKQKQTQDWRTTKATADAVFALLLRGRDLLGSTNCVEVTVGGVPLRSPDPFEAGTGFSETRVLPPDIRPESAWIDVNKTDHGIAWGGVHWQYLEDIAKVTPHAANPLRVQKRLWVRRPGAERPLLEAVDGPLSVGDELVIRLELRVNRDLEYVHLMDQRGSGTEPMSVQSGYRYQDRLRFYESTRDTASHFFFDHLPRGTHVLEYRVRVQLRGNYPMGVASIQCMYAPEFSSHSESIPVTVQ